MKQNLPGELGEGKEIKMVSILMQFYSCCTFKIYMQILMVLHTLKAALFQMLKIRNIRRRHAKIYLH